MSWRGNIHFLIYFGFMRGKLSKALFLIFAGAFCLPGKYSTSNETWLFWTVGITLMIAGVLQVLKYCNRPDETSTEHLK